MSVSNTGLIVYPSARVGTNTTDILKSRIFIQDNITNIIRNYSGNDIKGTFVVNPAGTNSGTIEFYIYGYYFSLPYTTISALGTGVGITVYAYIEVCQDNTLGSNYIYNDTDAGANYQGLTLTTEEPTQSLAQHGGTIRSIPLISGGAVPVNSTQRLSVIDGGEI